MGAPKVRVATRWREGELEIQCPTCGEWWDSTTKSWRPEEGMRRCRACWREYTAMRMRGVRADEAHGELIRTRQRIAYYANREKHLAAAKRWRDANKERIREYRRRYYIANREREIGNARQYNVEAREAIRIRKAHAKEQRAAA